MSSSSSTLFLPFEAVLSSRTVALFPTKETGRFGFRPNLAVKCNHISLSHVPCELAWRLTGVKGGSGSIGLVERGSLWHARLVHAQGTGCGWDRSGSTGSCRRKGVLWRNCQVHRCQRTGLRFLDPRFIAYLRGLEGRRYSPPRTAAAAAAESVGSY